MDGSDGLGNLADELAEAWDDDGGTTSQIEHVFGEHGGNGLSDDKRGRPILKIHHDAGISVPNTFRLDADDNQLLSPPNQLISSRRQGAASFPSDYDGSDYGDDSDLENTEGISASLEYRLAAIEGLARRGTEANGSGADTAVLRVAESLRDLASQAGVETGASRYGPSFDCNSSTRLRFWIQTHHRSYRCDVQFSSSDPSHAETLPPVHISLLSSSSP